MKQNHQLPNSNCENNFPPNSTTEKINHNVNAANKTNLDNKLSSSESLQNAYLKNNTSELNYDNVIDQNSYIEVIEVGSSAKYSKSCDCKVTDIDNTLGNLLRADGESGIQLTSFQPRKSTPVQAVFPFQQNNFVNSVDLQKKKKIVMDAPVENTDNLNNSLVSSQKQDVILDAVLTTDRVSVEGLETKQKNNEANSVDSHSHQSDVHMYDTVAPNEVETSISCKVVSKSSKENGEGDYVLYDESYDSYPEVEPDHVADYSDKKRSRISPDNDDIIEVDSGHISHPLARDKLIKSVDMSPVASSNLPSSVNDIKYNSKVLVYDVFAGRKRKNDQEDEATEDSDDENDDDPDYEMKMVRNGKKKTFKNAKKEILLEQKPKVLSSYEKMIEEKRAERIALLKSMEIYQIKEGISEAISGMKQLKKDRVKKIRSNEPLRRSKRLPAIKVNFSERALQNLALEKLVPIDASIPLEIHFEDVLTSSTPYEECVNELSVKEPRCYQEYISYDKSVFENMSLTKFHVCRVGQNRIASAAWYPSKEDLVVATGDNYGNLSLWKIQDSETTPHLFKVHVCSITNMQFSLFDPVQLITSSYDGTMQCGDLIKHTFNEIYRSDRNHITWFDFLSPTAFLVSNANGEVAVFDRKTNRKTSEQRHACHDFMINTVSVHPVNKNIFATCGTKKSICLWDLRKLQKNPVVEILHHKNQVNSAFFSPVAGNSILTTSMDDSICIFDSTNLTQDIQLTQMMNFNNRSTRLFKATWLPHSDDLFSVCCTEERKDEKKIQIYDKDLNLYHNLANDNLNNITLVQRFHPYRSALLASGNVYGKLFVFT